MPENSPYTYKTIQRYITDSIQGLYDEREARNIAKWLVEDMFSHKNTMNNDRHLSSEEIELVNQAIVRLNRNEPLQYITNKQEFYGYSFKVTPDVLIPRPETEELVNYVLKNTRHQKGRLLDIGTGSGCITISLQKSGDFADVSGMDVSQKALIIAQENAILNQAIVHWIEHDVLNENWPIGEIDIVVANPPYIPDKERKQIRENVLGHEPKTALFVPDNDPLLFYREISKTALQYLSKRGEIYFEIHENFAKELVALINELGYVNISVQKDLQGKDRILTACIS